MKELSFVCVVLGCKQLFLCILYHTIPGLMTQKNNNFENIVGKGENAGNQFNQFCHFEKD